MEEYWTYDPTNVPNEDNSRLVTSMSNTTNTEGKIMEIDYDFSYEEIDLTIKDVTAWFHDDIGGPSSFKYGLTLFNQTPRVGAVGLVNCLTKLDLIGQIIDQDCFYSNYGPGGWNWQDNNFLGFKWYQQLLTINKVII